MQYKIQIGIAEDHGLVRQGFIRMLHDFDEMEILFEACNGKQLLTNLRHQKPDIILLDIAMPVLGGIGAMVKIKERYPKLKIIVISEYSEFTSIIEYVKLGANAFLDKNCDVSALVAAIRSVSAGGTYFDEDTTKLLTKHGIFPSGYENKRALTDKEVAVLKLICNDKPYTEIAELVGLSDKTIYWYEHILLQKTKCADLQSLKAFAKNTHIV